MGIHVFVVWLLKNMILDFVICDGMMVEWIEVVEVVIVGCESDGDLRWIMCRG